jgi:hypothetical protein
MGYTHYWTQHRDFTPAKWRTITNDVKAIIKLASRTIQLADDLGEGKPFFDAETIMFNGIGDAGHETFAIDRESRGWSFCKTAEKPYDVVVVACLCYLNSIYSSHEITSDGYRSDWADGLRLAREALPRYNDRLAVPGGVKEETVA